MAEYIERNQVRDMLHSEIESWGSSAEEIDALLKANDKLFEIPAADVAPVVRCRDCANTCEVDDGLVCVVWGACCNADEFCSRAERKDGDD